MTRTPVEAARLALACLDLTSLNDDDTEAQVDALCERAADPIGAPAAVCVWARLARHAVARVPAGVKVAAVANFPGGAPDAARAVRDTAQIVEAGAHEVDVVMPWRAVLAGDDASAARALQAVRRACPALVLKVILETGELREAGAIERAARLALAEGADFLKTSTGKVPVNATPQAAELLLDTIATDTKARDRVGFKAAGGIRSVADAQVYFDLVERVLGPQALGPARFRIGASGLWNDIATILGRHAPATRGHGY
jgi:deoxyribose-phosphate aldolase